MAWQRPFSAPGIDVQARIGAMHEVTPSVAPKAVKMLMMVWIMNFQVSFLVIVIIETLPTPLKGGRPN